MYGASVRLWQVEEEGEGEELSIVLPEIDRIHSFILGLMGSLTKDFLVEEKTAVAVVRALPQFFQDSFVKKETAQFIGSDDGHKIDTEDDFIENRVEDNSMNCLDEIEDDATMMMDTNDKVFDSQNVIDGHDDDDIETSDLETDAQFDLETKELDEKNKKTKTSNKTSKQFHCSECSEVFTSNFYLKQHLKTHDSFWPYPCNICDGKFKEVKHLKKHMIDNHKDLFCPTCKVYHKNLTELDEHHCSKPYQCQSCHRRFGTVCELKAHSLIHSGEKPHMCDLCGKGFRQRATLDRHKLTHQSKKNYSCEICGKNFKFKHYLVSHKRLHTGEKPHMCTWCGQSFSQGANMQKHIKQQHTMEKSHVCKQCGKGFVQPYYLKRHLLTHKGDPLSPEKEKTAMSDECIGVRTVPCRFCSATTKTEAQLKIHMEMHHNLVFNIEKQTTIKETNEEQENKFHLLSSPVISKDSRPVLLVEHSNLQQLHHLHKSNHLNTPSNIGQRTLQDWQSFGTLKPKEENITIVRLNTIKNKFQLLSSPDALNMSKDSPPL